MKRPPLPRGTASPRSGEAMDERFPGIEIRLVDESELDVVHALWREAGLTFRPDGRDSLEHLAREIQSGQAFLAGAYAGPVMAGVVLGTSDGRKGWVNRLAIQPDFRGRGLGRALMGFCERRFASKGLGLSCCLIEDWNEPSLRLFQSEGYNLHKNIFYLRKFLGNSNW